MVREVQVVSELFCRGSPALGSLLSGTLWSVASFFESVISALFARVKGWHAVNLSVLGGAYIA